MKLAFLYPALSLFSMCSPDETIRAYGGANVDWQLIEMNGEGSVPLGRLSFPEQNKVLGAGPCNSFEATNSVPYPWFELENFASTKAVCPDQDRENLYFDALSVVSLSEVQGTTMILSSPGGVTLVFSAAVKKLR